MTPRPAAGRGRDARHRDEVQRVVRHRVRVDEDVAVRGAARRGLALLDERLRAEKMLWAEALSSEPRLDLAPVDLRSGSRG